ncbi:uncharacterized protein PHACADRAFT_261690 [Phanerochaete carnosa HHB-10118-sp]|uniref:Uncharacterized protein n=1 Tax=Phanerochaete carnosa (strain HHB-10118-sp) TaxID=650164 RepID=K5WMH9_PHACS|nr:uncharacterized protein PHACADRAFT_261690 [Phanerochaete carnosa HHB-10118-sp]EKM51507.1 hypothetical protein PHACADRAFT_261690 [Phanerochaete carnosa HHB-10118-sp]
MLNLRSIPPSGNASETHSFSGHFSRFTVSNFLVPEIGNIGEPLDYTQVEQLICGLDERLVVEEGVSEDVVEGVVAGSQEAGWEDNQDVYLDVRGI